MKREREYQNYLSAVFNLDKRVEIARKMHEGLASIDEASEHYGVREEDLMVWIDLAKRTFQLEV